MNSLIAELSRVSSILRDHGIAHATIGGLAVIAWGEARTTRDIDLSVEVSDDRLPELLEAANEIGSTRTEDPLTFARTARVLPLISTAGVPIDLILATLTFELDALERAEPVDLGGGAIPFISAHDLLLMKLVSERSRDLDDARGILVRSAARIAIDPLRAMLDELASNAGDAGPAERLTALLTELGR